MPQYLTNSPADSVIEESMAAGEDHAGAPDEQDGPLSTTDLHATLMRVLGDAEKLVEDELTPARELATRYYHGEPFGDEDAGRSDVVLTEVADTIHGLMPSILEVLEGPEHVVEFQPRKPEQAQAARHATDRVRYIFEEEQGGFLKTYDVLLDGFVRRMGIFKWGWVDSEARVFELPGVTQEQVDALQQDESVTILKIEEDEPAPADVGADAYPASSAPQPGAAPQTGAQPQADPDGDASAEPDNDGDEAGSEARFRVTVRRADGNGHVAIWSVAPEDFLFTREATSVDDATAVAHRTELTRGELVSMGIDEDLIDRYGGTDTSRLTNADRQARMEVLDEIADREPEAGAASRRHFYTEVYIRLDWEGTGISDVRKVCCLGPTFYPVTEPEPVTRPCFSIFCPRPEPHTIAGGSIADATMDMQRVKSFVFRSQLDSLALALYPRVAFVENRVSVEDLLNPDIGAPIRMSAPGMVMPFAHDFVGREAFPVLSFIDDIIERRTGQNKGAAGLEMDALQSTTKEGVEAATTASQAQLKLLTRLFVEQAMKPLFRGILQLLIDHDPDPQLAYLRGMWETIEPGAWDADMPLRTRVALGGMDEKRTATLLALAGEQKDILTTFGPSNPLVTIAQYRQTLVDLARLGGVDDAELRFNQVPADWQPPAAPPQESPEQTMAKATLAIEQIKAERDFAIKQAELALKQQEMTLQHQRELAKQAADNVLRLYQINAQFKSDYTEMSLEHDARQNESFLDGALNIAQLKHKREVDTHAQLLAAHQQGHDQALDQDQQAHDQSMAERAADTADAAAENDGQDDGSEEQQ